MCVRVLEVVFVLIVNARARPSRPAGSQGGGTEGEIEAEVNAPNISLC